MKQLKNGSQSSAASSGKLFESLEERTTREPPESLNVWHFQNTSLWKPSEERGETGLDEDERVLTLEQKLSIK